MSSELVLVRGRSNESPAKGKADPLQGYWCERIPRCPRRRPTRRKRLSCQRVRNHSVSVSRRRLVEKNSPWRKACGKPRDIPEDLRVRSRDRYYR